MNISIEIERNNVTVAEFLAYVKRHCAQKGADGFGVDRDYFENPPEPFYRSYFVKDGVQYNTIGEPHSIPMRGYSVLDGVFQTVMEFRNYEGNPTSCAKGEISKDLPYDYQAYICNSDGSVFNEICEFTFDSENRGHGYYYLLNKDAPAGECAT
jgi:hypothetical protein